MRLLTLRSQGDVHVASDRFFGLTIGLLGYLIFRGWVGLTLLNIPFIASMLIGFLAVIRLHDRFAST